jgi:fumarate reductase flavoprotein subunit
LIEVREHDLLIVGAGAAGLRAAIAAAEADPEASIAVVSKVYPMRSHTVSAEGGAAAVARDDDSIEMHGYDTVKGSDFLGDQDVIEYFVEEAPKELTLLDHWGWWAFTSCTPCSNTRCASTTLSVTTKTSPRRSWWTTDRFAGWRPSQSARESSAASWRGR